MSRPYMAPVKKNKFLVGFRIMNSIIPIGVAFYALYLFVTAGSEVFGHPFIKRISRYNYLFISAWAGLGMITSLNCFTAIDIIDIYFQRHPKAKELKNKLHYVGSFLLFSIAFPVEVVVCSNFWILYYYDKENFYPDIAHALMPPAMNHINHTAPPFLAIFLIVTTNQRKPPKSHTLLGTSIFLGVYAICTCFIKIYTGDWVYVVYDSFTNTQMVFVFAVNFIAALAFNLLGYLLYDFAVYF